MGQGWHRPGLRLIPGLPPGFPPRHLIPRSLDAALPVPSDLANASQGQLCGRNRLARDICRCVMCGFTEQADVNAAKILLKRGLLALEHDLAS